MGRVGKQLAFLFRIGTPEEKYHGLLPIVQQFDDAVGQSFPAEPFVTVCLSGAVPANNRLRLRYGVLLCAFLAVCLLRFAHIVLCSGRCGVFLFLRLLTGRKNKKQPRTAVVPIIPAHERGQ